MIKIKNQIPGPNSIKVIEKLRKLNGGWSVPYPFVHSSKGSGCYLEDVDGNKILDFGSQISSNPFGYNNEEMISVVKKYSSRHPIKFAGQDFIVPEHPQLIEELVSISPKGMNAGFLVNSGAEAVENAIKISMRRRPKTQFSVSFNGAFHGRTLGALSLHHSKPVHRRGYLLEPNKELPFDETAPDVLKKIIDSNGADSIGFVILEHFQGEGGYRIPSNSMVKGIYSIAQKHKIPYIADEVQAGMGRTGKWWSFEHYNVKPDVFSSAKALQVGAVVSSKNNFPSDPGSISSTWGGGHIIDMALGLKTIEIIKRDRLLNRNTVMGNKMLNSLQKIDGLTNPRGRGLMLAFDMPDSITREKFIIEALKNGLVLLGAGERSVRVIPPYVIDQKEIDEGLRVIESTTNKVLKKYFELKGRICDFMDCSYTYT